MKRLFSIFFLVIVTSIVASNCGGILTAQAADLTTQIENKSKIPFLPIEWPKKTATSTCQTSSIEKEATVSSEVVTPDEGDQRPSASPAGVFEPDLGYQTIKDCLPTSRLDNINSLEELWGAFWTNSNLLVAILALFGIIFSGIMYITAGNNPDRTKTARSSIIGVITGIVIYILAIQLLSWLPGVIGGFFK